MTNQDSLITIIIPTYLRQDIALKTIKSLSFQDFEDFEVVVVDQSPKKHNKLEYFEHKKFTYKYINIDQVGLPNARNIGAEMANGEILIFIDDDCIPNNNFISEFNNIFIKSDKEMICIGGRVIEKNSKIFKNKKTLPGGWFSWYGKTLKNLDTEQDGACEWAPGGNFAVKKQHYFMVKGFDINFIGNAMLEDVDFGFRFVKFGGEVYFSHLPEIEHLREVTGGTRSESMDKGMFYRSHNTVYFLRKHKKMINLFPAFLYLNAVALNDLFRMKHSLLAFFWCWNGFFSGFKIKINQ